jgi:hypothetical protein
MNTLFADSFYFFALINNQDEAHQSAREYSLRHTGRIVTMPGSSLNWLMDFVHLAIDPRLCTSIND